MDIDMSRTSGAAAVAGWAIAQLCSLATSKKKKKKMSQLASTTYHELRCQTVHRSHNVILILLQLLLPAYFVKAILLPQALVTVSSWQKGSLPYSSYLHTVNFDVDVIWPTGLGPTARPAHKFLKFLPVSVEYIGVHALDDCEQLSEKKEKRKKNRWSHVFVTCSKPNFS